MKQSKANTLDVAEAVRRELVEIADELPPGVVTRPRVRLGSIFVERSIEDVSRTIFEAIVLVVIVIYLFLRSAARHLAARGSDPGLDHRHLRGPRTRWASRSTRSP